MITISTLSEATDAAFTDISDLLRAFHEGSTSTYTPEIERLRMIVSDPHIDLIVAKDGEKVIGMTMLYTMLHVDEIGGHIDDVVVSEAYRGQGIATKILMSLIDIARQKGLKHIDLTSRPTREAANHLYQKIGFQKRETNPYRLKL